MTILPAALLAVLSTAAAAQPQVQLQVHVGESGDGTQDKPAVTWSDAVLKVSAVTAMTAIREVSAQSPGITVGDGTVTLCYHEKVTPPAPGQMVPRWARPVLLEFSVTGLPKRDYTVSVSTCP